MSRHLLYALFVVGLLISPKIALAVTAASTPSPYLFDFNQISSVEEASSEINSGSPYWYVNSGAYLKMDGSRGSTNLGELALTDYWKNLYSLNNPVDTDLGFHPQNIFRLITRSKWENFRQEAYFVIKKSNLSDSPNRNQSNGILLFNRYKDSQDLYYTGVRVDGSAIIKKKKNGIYYTMAEIKNVFPGTYNHDTNPNLLTLNKWIGLRSEVYDEDGLVKIKLYTDKNWTGTWQLVAEVADDGKTYGGAAITGAGFAGIRTDFMDVQFENYRLRNL